MEKAFPGSYALTSDGLRAIWPDAFISFDANVLLNLYRYSADTQAKLLKAMDQVSQRGKLRLTHQAVSEFHRNRMVRIQDQDTKANALASHFEKLCTSVENTIDGADHHPNVDLEQIRQIAEDAREKATKLLTHTNRQRVNPADDEILKQLTAIVGDAFAPAPSPETVDARRQEASERFAAKIPPGYMDAKKENGGVGDYLIWCELLDFARQGQCPIILVTNDRKEDWWELYEVDSQARAQVCPRYELVTEMHETAGVRYYQLLPLDFITMELQSELSPEVADELSKAPLEDVLAEIVKDAPPPYIAPRQAASAAVSWDDSGLGGALRGAAPLESSVQQAVGTLAQFQRAFQESVAASAMPVADAYQQMMGAISGESQIAELLNINRTLASQMSVFAGEELRSRMGLLTGEDFNKAMREAAGLTDVNYLSRITENSDG